MPRIARVVLPEVPFHLTHKGNNGQHVFFAESDRALYVNLLREYSTKHGLDILAFCLMRNHVHIVGIPLREDSLAKMIGIAHLRYAQFVNKREQRSGHLWEGRYYSCPLDDGHLVAAIRYVERNPVRARVVAEPWTYPWSSALAHILADDPYGVLNLRWWRRRFDGTEWREFLIEQDNKDIVEAIRSCTRTGRPLGNDEFIAELEKKTGRRLHALQCGRPKKN